VGLSKREGHSRSRPAKGVVATKTSTNVTTPAGPLRQMSWNKFEVSILGNGILETLHMEADARSIFWLWFQTKGGRLPSTKRLRIYWTLWSLAAQRPLISRFL